MKQKCGLQITNDKVYMATTFQDFTEMLVMNMRGEDQEEEFTYDAVSQLVTFLLIHFCLVLVITICYYLL